MKCQAKLAATLLALACIAQTTANAAVYVVDTSQSSITITGAIDLGLEETIPIIPQSPGSNVVSLQGTLDVDDLGATLLFNSAAIDGIENPGPFSPGVVTPGDPPVVGPPAPGDAALYIADPSFGSIVLRDLLISITGNADPGAPNFDLADLTLSIFGSGDYDIALLGEVGNLALDGESATFPGGTGSLVGDTLTIPISIDIVQQLEVTPGNFADVIVSLQGQLVANLVPEPSSIAMLGLGVIGLVAVGRRRFRKA